ncbi:MAG: hypothetical protein KJN90_00060 [Gammaproteobacteria bacterium]|nr:hypothetical protein [Gammaproteobacteria bacterium]
MDKFSRELIKGFLLLSALGVAQVAWAQQHDHDDQAGQSDQSAEAVATDSGQIFDSSQLAGQDQSAMQRRQGGMMRGGQGDGQGNMMQQRQGQQGQGGMMQNGHGDGQQGMMEHGQNGENGDMMQQMRRRMGGGGMGGGMGGGQNRNSGGQDAFSAIRTVVSQLEANPETDWSKVDISALRNHLIDMHEVTVNAQVETTEVEGGASYRVTGRDRTLAAIRNMVPMHASQMTGETEWTAVAEEIRNGVEVTVTAASDDQVAKIRALGFMGFMVSGEHHEAHHMAIVGADMESMSASGGGHSH